MSVEDRLREDALTCWDAALRACAPRRLVAQWLRENQAAMEVLGKIHMVSVGKAAAAMAQGAVEVLGSRLAGGVVALPHGQEGEVPAGLVAIGAGHPDPDSGSVAAGREIRDQALLMDERDLLLCLISGGGSAMLSLPPSSVPVHDVAATSEALARAGAGIEDLNCVRKHLDYVKGGRLAAAAAPARVQALMLSDVVGDSLDVIASGPVSPDPTTFFDAVEVLQRFRLWAEVPMSVRDHLRKGMAGEEIDTPGQHHTCFESVAAHVVGNNLLALEAALAEASRLGYDAGLYAVDLVGEARDVGSTLASAAHRLVGGKLGRRLPACLASGGETTVTVRGSGVGGRNQELALAAALELSGKGGVVLLSAGTDGIDGPTNAAGAIVDGYTIHRALARGLDPRRALRNNDSHTFFRTLGDLVVSGPTGTNVMDLQLLLAAAY
ncbi:MAG: DUF4147 domain-containing protein [Acidobacteriota bacterium]